MCHALISGEADGLFELFGSCRYVVWMRKRRERNRVDALEMPPPVLVEIFRLAHEILNKWAELFPWDGRSLLLVHHGYLSYDQIK
jgi:hypothetical protein